MLMWRRIKGVVRRWRYRRMLRDPRWRALRCKVVELNGRRCVKCSATGRLEVHHVRYKSGSSSFDVEGLAVTPQGRSAYVAGFGPGLLFEIRTLTNTVVDTVTGLGRTFGVAITPDGRFVYVTDEQGGVVSVIRSTDDKVVSNGASGC